MKKQVKYVTMEITVPADSVREFTKYVRETPPRAIVYRRTPVKKAMDDLKEVTGHEFVRGVDEYANLQNLLAGLHQGRSFTLKQCTLWYDNLYRLECPDLPEVTADNLLLILPYFLGVNGYESLTMAVEEGDLNEA